MRFVASAVVAFLLLALSLRAEDLNISPVGQKTPVWCWLAVGEMVFEHYDIPGVNPARGFQCGVVGLISAGTSAAICAADCAQCIVPAGNASNVVMMLREYPRRVATLLGRSVPRLNVAMRTRLSQSAVRSQIDDENPILAGISPSGTTFGATSQHVVLIVGYDDEGDELRLLVNDPYPYGAADPYTANGGESNEDGSYWITYATFAQRLRWKESITVRESGTYRPAAAPSRREGGQRMASRCCFMGPYGADSCPLNLSGALPAGSPCTCSYPNVWFAGQACN